MSLLAVSEIGYLAISHLLNLTHCSLLGGASDVRLGLLNRLPHPTGQIIVCGAMATVIPAPIYVITFPSPNFPPVHRLSFDDHRKDLSLFIYNKAKVMLTIVYLFDNIYMAMNP